LQSGCDMASGTDGECNLEGGKPAAGLEGQGQQDQTPPFPLPAGKPQGQIRCVCMQGRGLWSGGPADALCVCVCVCVCVCIHGPTIFCPRTDHRNLASQKGSRHPGPTHFVAFYPMANARASRRHKQPTSRAGKCHCSPVYWFRWRLSVELRGIAGLAPTQ
jgi:hypothetical protein